MKNIIVDDPKISLREMRESVCFPIINRGRLWYNSLTIEQTCELKKWYLDWLNVTDTMVIPETPGWLNNKIQDEELII